jgi:DNA repair exonuclease SbcCD ATPase subunit
VAAIALFSTAARARRARLEGHGRITRLETEQLQAREGARKALAPIEQAIADSGLRTLEEFLAAARRAEQLRRRRDELMGRVSETEQLRAKMAAECNELYARLKEVLAGVGLSCAPATLRAQVDLLRANLRRFRDLDARYRSCRQNLSSLTDECAGLTRESEAKAAAIQAILSEAGVASPEAFRQSCRARQLVLELKEKATSRMREFRRLCGALTLDQWRVRVLELEAAERRAGPPPRQPDAPMGLSGPPEPGAPLLPYMPTTEEAEAEEKQVAADLASRREAHARLAERVRHAFQSYRSASEIDEDVAVTETALRSMEMNRQALAAAVETIRSLSRRQQEVLAPQLNRAVEQRFLRLCSGRYEEVKIDPDFVVWLREAGTGELRNAENVSRGTQDQVYFALRFGILDLVSNAAEPSPCLLDEPFAAYDRSRLEEAFRILADEASSRQLFLFTCREDLGDLAKTRGAHIVTIEENP